MTKPRMPLWFDLVMSAYNAVQLKEIEALRVEGAVASPAAPNMPAVAPERPQPTPDEVSALGEMGLEVTAFPFTRAKLKEAFRLLAVRHHPDQGGDAEAFMAVWKAYRLLLKTALP